MSSPDPSITSEPAGLPAAISGTLPIRFRNFVARQLELIFVVVLITTVTAVFWLVPYYKIAFLNLFYMPVLLAAYFLGRRRAVLGATFCILLVALFALRGRSWVVTSGIVVEFRGRAYDLDTMVLIATWGGFLILTSAAIGSLQEKLNRGFVEIRQLYEDLKQSRVAEEMKEKVEKTLFATMDPIVAKLAIQGKLRYEKREISIMFTDLTDFTPYSDQNRPDVVLEELNRFLGEIEPVVETFRGHIDKFMGDGVMIEYGAPIDYERHALLAVLAGLKMQEKVDGLKLPWRLRVGISTGSAVVGMIGARRQSYSALGDTVNVAKRLEEICEPQKVYVDNATFREGEPFVEASKVRQQGLSRKEDRALLEFLTHLEEEMGKTGEDPKALLEMGKLHFQLHDATQAIQCFERALALEPNSPEIKLAYADAVLKKDDYEKIQLKGKLRKISVYEINGVKDRWRDPTVIPPPVQEKYLSAEKLIDVRDEVVLAVEALDGSVGHGRVAALLSYALGDRLRVNEDLKQQTLLAGYLQNIGKEAVPHHILNRPSSLTEHESGLVNKYVAESVTSLRRMGFNNPTLLEIVAHHQEKWDGTGTPDGLKGDKIPIGSRITAVAADYSALTAWRPYREAWDPRLALSELKKGVEKGRYDPQVVSSLTELFSQKT